MQDSVYISMTLCVFITANSDFIARLTIQTFHILCRISCQKDAFWHNHQTIFIVLVVFNYLKTTYTWKRKSFQNILYYFKRRREWVVIKNFLKGGRSEVIHNIIKWNVAGFLKFCNVINSLNAIDTCWGQIFVGIK